jgi:hypothetical protein
MTAGWQLSKDGEAGGRGQAGEHQHLADADAGREPGPEGARGESDDSLRSDRQPGDQRRVLEYLLEVQRQHQHLAPVPQSE